MRTYIAPNKTGTIFDIEVTANIPNNLNNINFSKKQNLKPVCNKCVLSSKCTMQTRPACFGNDKENTSNLPIYYVKA